MQNIDALVGSVRRVGNAGPPYEILGLSTALTGDAPLVRIRVIESGEDLDYPLSDLLNDPRDD